MTIRAWSAIAFLEERGWRGGVWRSDRLVVKVTREPMSELARSAYRCWKKAQRRAKSREQAQAEV